MKKQVCIFKWIICTFFICCILIIIAPKLGKGQILPLLLQQSYQRFVAARFVPNQIILYFEPGITPTQIISLYVLYGLKEISASPLSGAHIVLSSPLINLQELIIRLNIEPIVILAEPNYIGQVSFIPNDLYYRYQWNMKLINLENAWNLSTGLGITVAVLDTGVAFENYDIYAQAPDLAGTRFVSGWDFVNGDANPDDDAGHGTHITGTIAQTTNNIYGCAGVAFNSTIMPVKVMDADGNGALTDIVNGIYYAVNNGANVINMSFGFGNNPTVSLQTAVEYAYNNGVTMVCSAGNNSTNLPNYPASYPECISVSGVRYDLTLGSYSNYGAEIDLCAPGGDLAVDQNLDGYPDGILQQSHDGTNYTTFSLLLGKGTSWSAAHVSGVVALMQAYSGGLLSPLQVDQILKDTAIDLGDPGWDQYYGYGLVDACAAVIAATQASVASAEAFFSPYVAQTLAAQQALTLFPLSRISSVSNPVATVNGDLSFLNPASLLSVQSLTPPFFDYTNLLWQLPFFQTGLPFNGYPLLTSYFLPSQANASPGLPPFAGLINLTNPFTLWSLYNI